jgi:tellurite resistance protein TerC
VFTSNIFAILGLRSLYFLLAGVIQRFVHLKVGLAVVLVFVGAKMLLGDVYALPVAASLGVIAAILGAAVVASLWAPAGRTAPARPAAAAEERSAASSAAATAEPSREFRASRA